MVWEGYDGSDYEIFLYDGSGGSGPPQKISNKLDWEDFSPEINNNGWVVWVRRPRYASDATDSEIFLYDGTGPPQQITNNSWDDRDPRINDNGTIVWNGGGSIYLVKPWEAYSRYYFNFYYNNGSGDYYTGYVYAPSYFNEWLNVKSKLYEQPMEFWAMGYKSFNGGYYEITEIAEGFDSSYDKKSYITAYYDADPAHAILGVNSDGSRTPDNIYVPDRTVFWEMGYAISRTINDTFSVYKEADVPIKATGSYAAAMPQNSTSSSVYEEADVPVALVSYGAGIPVNSSSGLLDEDE